MNRLIILCEKAAWHLIPESSDILDNYKVNKFPSMVYISLEGKIINDDFTFQKYADNSF